jgi:hypothetical protein
MGLHEMKGALLQEDLDSWKPLLEWLEHRSPAPAIVESAPQAASSPVAPAEIGEGARG